MIKKFKSQNLLGESRKEEEKRLRNERIKLKMEGRFDEAKEVRRGGTGYLLGTTQLQRKKRRSMLR